MAFDPVSNPRIQAVGESGCWIWLGEQNSDGYGRVHVGGGKRVLAHHVSYLAARGSIPNGKCVCHRCDVRSCVNPDHLWIGTHAENMRDRNLKGRSSGGRNKGEKSPVSKLTEQQVTEIFNAPGSQVEIAKRFGLAKSHVCRIKSRKTWTHLTEHLA